MNKFGMFIHWGIYSKTGLHEQALARYALDKTEYEKIPNSFNPTLYNPEDWVLLAKKAGMKYICFTAKHHDGFCMWDTKYTDYKITNTPYKKDVLKMLADACKKHGMLLSLYYSNPDWHNEYAYNEKSTHQWCCTNREKSDIEKYKTYIKNQLTELLTGYGKIYTLFWDIPTNIEDKSMNEHVRSLQPDILINDRGWDKGDFSTPERSVPDGARFERMTEACQSVGEQAWGYRVDEDYFSVRYLTSSIDKIMAMGGSYLLNVGPNEFGEIPPRSREIIEKVGDWYYRVGETLENHNQSSKNLKLRGNIPFVATEKNCKTYIHLYNGIPSSAIAFESGIDVEPKKAILINDGRELRVRNGLLPGWGNGQGYANGPFVSIADIPVDEYESEPMIIELIW